MKSALLLAVAYSCGATCETLNLDPRVFAASLDAGAAVAVGESRGAAGRLLAQALDADQLAAALAFYRSADGRAALRAKAAFQAKRQAKLATATKSPSYQPTAPEAAFLDSPPGRALLAAGGRPEAKFAGSDPMQAAVDATEADYCRHAVCGADQHRLFKQMRVIFNPDRARGEHAMFGDTAGDLFTRPQDAALAREACVGDADGIARSLKDGAVVDAQGGEGVGPGAVRMTVTPLLWAIDCGSLVGVTALLDARADPNQSEKFGATPVTLAAAGHDPAILQLLLRRGGDPNAHNGRETALEIGMGAEHELERAGHVPRPQALANWDALIAAGADPLRVAPNGRPLIQSLVFAGDFDMAEWLMDHGWNGDPVELGRTVETMEGTGRFSTPDTLAVITRIKDRLQARGVRFPVGPLAKLNRDARGFYLQP